MIDTIGPGLFKGYQTPGRFLGMPLPWNTTNPGWRVEPNPEFVARYKQNNPNATDEQMNKYFFRTMLIKYYKQAQESKQPK